MAMAWRGASRAAQHSAGPIILPGGFLLGVEQAQVDVPAVRQTRGDSHEWGERRGDKERRVDDDDTGMGKDEVVGELESL
jgi:hypothetical protein